MTPTTLTVAQQHALSASMHVPGGVWAALVVLAFLLGSSVAWAQHLSEKDRARRG